MFSSKAVCTAAVAEMLGNYMLPAPQRVSDMAFAYCKSQVRCCNSVQMLTLPEVVAATAAAPLSAPPPPPQQQQFSSSTAG